MLKITATEPLFLPIGRTWDGHVLPVHAPSAFVEIQQAEGGIWVIGSAQMATKLNIPDASPKSRVEGLWQYDVVEVFFLDEGEQYLEVELGLGGHFLVLGFDGIRNRVTGFETEPFLVQHEQKDGWYTTRLLLPETVFPQHLQAINAFAILGGQYFAYHPLPGGKPDFHQPAYYPLAQMS